MVLLNLSLIEIGNGHGCVKRLDEDDRVMVERGPMCVEVEAGELSLEDRVCLEHTRYRVVDINAVEAKDG
jgi:hypothetical protein